MGGLAYAEEGDNGRMHATIRIVPDELIWEPSILVMPHGGELDLDAHRPGLPPLPRPPPGGRCGTGGQPPQPRTSSSGAPGPRRAHPGPSAKGRQLKASGSATAAIMRAAPLSRSGRMWISRAATRPRRSPTNDITAVMAPNVAAENQGENPSSPRLAPANKLSRLSESGMPNSAQG